MHYKEYKSILSPHNGMNIYRGCTHGCIYCDSRSTCYQMLHDFEDIEIKSHAPEMLDSELRRKRKRCIIGTGAMTDSYIPLEKEIKYMRSCLEIVEKHGFGIAIQTKSDLILRDLDLLKKINQNAKCVVQMTLTTYDEDLCRIIEPDVCTTGRRVEVLKIMNENNIPTVVWLTPILPFINDTAENLNGIIDICVKAGVKKIINFGMGLTLREGDREYYYAALDKHFPDLKERYQERYGLSYELKSDNHDYLMKIFIDRCRRENIMHSNDKIFRYMYEFPEKAEQLSLDFFN